MAAVLTMWHLLVPFVCVGAVDGLQPSEVLHEQLLPSWEASDVASRHRKVQVQAVA